MNARQQATGVRCWPVAEWPAADQAAWTHAQRPGTPFEPGGLAAGWSAASRQMAIQGYGRWLAWLHTAGLLDVNAPPAARVARQRLLAYTAALQQVNAPLTVQSRVRELGNAMRAMAPEQDWNWILRGADRLRAVAVPLRDKRQRLVSPDRLIALGRAIMDAAEADDGLTAIRRAADYRDGLLMAFLAYRPFRLADLSRLRYGIHLTRQGDGWQLDLVVSKGRIPMQMPFPAKLVPRLERYLTEHRPVLLDVGARHGRPPTDALWISSIGTAAGAAIIQLQITRRTAAAFGRSVNPHLFRDCAATFVAEMEAEQASIIRMILGHTTMAMSERTYNHAAARHAVRRYQATLDSVRRSTAPP